MMVLYGLEMLESHTGAILIVTGVLTLAAAAAIVAPRAILREVFGSAGPGEAAVAVTRHWGLLVTVIGALLVYAGLHPELRVAVMVAAATEKLGVGAIFGTGLPRRPPLLAVIGTDVAMAILYIVILATARPSV